MTKPRAGTSKKKKNRSASSHKSSLALLYQNHYKWLLLGILSLAYLIWFLIFGLRFLSEDFTKQIAQPAGTYPLTDQYSIFLYLVLWVLLKTSELIWIYEILMQFAMVFGIWYALKTLFDLGLSKKAINGIMLFYVFFPMFFYLANYVSKEQPIAVICLILVVEIYKVCVKKQVNLKQCFIIPIFFILLILMKTFFAIMIIAFVACGILVKQLRWKLILIGGVGMITAIVINFGLIAVTGSTSIASKDWMSVPTHASAAIFSDPNSNISDDDRAYFTKIYDTDFFHAKFPDLDSSEWYTRYRPLITDEVRLPLWYTDLNIPEYLAKVTGLCFANFGTCVGSYLSLMSGFYLPTEVQSAALQLPRRPFFVNFTSEGSDVYISTSTVRWSNQDFCSDLENQKSFEEFRTCIVNNIGETGGNQLAYSLEPVVRASLWDKATFPELGQAIISFWDFLSIFLEGFWLFWFTIALLILSYIKPSFRFARSAIWCVVSIYIGLFLTAPVAYERYLWPVYLLLPFVFGVFLSQKQANQKSKRR
jgi:hypothetical protein